MSDHNKLWAFLVHPKMIQNDATRNVDVFGGVRSRDRIRGAGLYLFFHTLYIFSTTKNTSGEKNAEAILRNPKKSSKKKHRKNKKADDISWNIKCAQQKNKIAKYNNAATILRIPMIFFTTNCP